MTQDIFPVLRHICGKNAKKVTKKAGLHLKYWLFVLKYMVMFFFSDIARAMYSKKSNNFFRRFHLS